LDGEAIQPRQRRKAILGSYQKKKTVIGVQKVTRKAKGTVTPRVEELMAEF